MAIAFHASGTGTFTNVVNGGSVAPTKPAVSTNDILIIAFGLNAGTVSPPSITAPTGWTLIGSQITGGAGSSGAGVSMYWALQSVASLAFTANRPGATTLDVEYVIASFSGVDNVTPIDATGTGTTNSGSATISIATFNTVTDQALEVFGITDWNGSSTFSQASFNILPSGTPATIQGALCYAKNPTTPAGGTGAFTLTDNAGASGNVLAYQQFALRPAAAVAIPNRLYSYLQGVNRAGTY